MLPKVCKTQRGRERTWEQKHGIYIYGYRLISFHKFSFEHAACAVFFFFSFFLIEAQVWEMSWHGSCLSSWASKWVNISPPPNNQITSQTQCYALLNSDPALDYICKWLAVWSSSRLGLRECWKGVLSSEEASVPTRPGEWQLWPQLSTERSKSPWMRCPEQCKGRRERPCQGRSWDVTCQWDCHFD